VETGCVWPPENAVPWVQRARARGVDPTVYCNWQYGLPGVRAAFIRAGVPEPHYWVAKYDGVREVPAGTVGKQHSAPEGDGVAHAPGHYDISSIADHWPGVDSSAPGGGGGQGQGDPDMPIVIKGAGSDAFYVITSDGQDFIKRHIDGPEAELLEKAGIRAIELPQAQVDAIPSMWDGLTNQLSQTLRGDLGALGSKIDAGFGKLSDDEANIIAAVRSIPTGGQPDIPNFVAALVPALAPVMAKLVQAGATVEQVKQATDEAVHKAFARAGS
jgi:hypothetical protein